MLHPTMLGDVGPTCWLRLNRPLVGFINAKTTLAIFRIVTGGR